MADYQNDITPIQQFELPPQNDQAQRKTSKWVSRIIMSIAFLFLLWLVVSCACVAGIYSSRPKVDPAPQHGMILYGTQQSSATIAQPTNTPGNDFSKPTHISDGNVPKSAYDMLNILDTTVLPEYNPYNLDLRVGRITGNEPTPQPAPAYHVGDKSQFWVQNVDNLRWKKITATLVAAGNNTYLWVEDGVKYNRDDTQKLVTIFDQKIYPMAHKFFGSEAKPGIDGDNHVYILYTTGMGSSVAGYFSSVDTYPKSVFPHSNEHEMFFISADNVKSISGHYILGVLAHEFQHMIHWAHDKNEETWLNEGLSELSSYLSGYGEPGYEFSYVSNPDLQLTTWPDPQERNESSIPHYGAAYLFTSYLFSRYGEDFIKSLVANPLNGMRSVDSTLHHLGYTDTSRSVFFDWAVANFVDSRLNNVPDIYRYTDLKFLPQINPTTTISCRQNEEKKTFTVHQFGLDYIALSHCPANTVVTFTGVPTVRVLEVDAKSGKKAAWSNGGDMSDTTMTHMFDLRGVKNATLEYDLYFNIEPDYDYGYVMASIDGKKWRLIKTDNMKDSDKVDNLGHGYTGNSRHWLHEKIDLSKYAGHRVFIRFEYVTDMAVHRDGMLIDNISIPEIDYFNGFESKKNCDEWDMKGFVCLENQLPQEYMVGLITIMPNGSLRVRKASTVGDMSERFKISGGENFLVVSGITPHTTIKAPYQIEIKSSLP